MTAAVYRHSPRQGPSCKRSQTRRPDSDGRNSHVDRLLSYRQFVEEMERDVPKDAAIRMYNEYRRRYIDTKKRQFFELHRGLDWFKDQYDPSHVEFAILRRNQRAQMAAKEFLHKVAVHLDVGPSATPSMTFSAAKKAAVAQNAPKANPVSSHPARVSRDIQLGQALVKKLDAEKGIEGNVLGSSRKTVAIRHGPKTLKALEGLELLDLIITYLWRIHGLDYYGMIELKEVPKGLRHIRMESNVGYDEEAAAEWEKKLDFTWESRLRGRDPLEVMTAREKLEAAVFKAMRGFVRSGRDGISHVCGVGGCGKAFDGAEYVQKHLIFRHPDVVAEATTRAKERIYFDNYRSDANAVTGDDMDCVQVMAPMAPAAYGDQQRPLRIYDEIEWLLEGEVTVTEYRLT